MAYKFVPYAPEGSGGKDPILGELVVTENGVYDEPTVNGEVVISWDGNPDGHELGSMLMGESAFPLVKVSDKALTASDLTGAIVRVFGMNEPVELVDGLAPLQVSETMTFAVDGMVVSGSGSFSTEYASIELPTAGTYFLYMGEGEMYATEITLPNASTPADGWNKVTVNVAGDIIDVPELPTENIEDGKIYRVIKETTKSNAEIWIALSPSIVTNIPGSKPIMLAEEMLSLSGTETVIEYHMVNSLPEVGMPTETEAYMHVYIVDDLTSEAFIYNEQFGGWVPMSQMDFGTYLGTVNDESDMEEVDDTYMSAYYILRKENVLSSTTYGIPDEANNKTVMEHNGSEWVECGAGSGGTGGDSIVVDVEELPTENVDETKIYRLSEEKASLYVSAMESQGVECDFAVMIKNMTPPGAVATVKYILVDALPENMEATSMSGGVYSYVIYIVRGEWEPKMYYRDQIMPLASMLGLSFVGTISDPSECENEGLYVLLGNVTNYGIPNSNDNRRIYQYKTEWEDVSGKLDNIPAMELQISNLNSKIEEKDQKIYEQEPYAEFAKRSTVVLTDLNGITLVSFKNPVVDGRTNLVRVKIPEFIHHINSGAFNADNCMYVTEIEFLTSFASIGAGAFTSQSELTKAVLNGVYRIDEEAFKYCYKLKDLTLSEKLESIGANAFYTTKIETLTVPASVGKIGDYAFRDNPLTTVSFKGTPNTLSSTAFYNCRSLTDIYVPWAEGAVANAPWGATNATIHYNHTT